MGAPLAVLAYAFFAMLKASRQQPSVLGPHRHRVDRQLRTLIPRDRDPQQLRTAMRR